MLAMKESGAHTLAQDETTCVVYGMPKEAVKLGAVDEIVPLPQIARAIIKALEPDAQTRQFPKRGERS
jgi:two-component system chemotaxis response regulator CheB